VLTRAKDQVLLLSIFSHVMRYLAVMLDTLSLISLIVQLLVRISNLLVLLLFYSLLQNRIIILECLRSLHKLRSHRDPLVDKHSFLSVERGTLLGPLILVLNTTIFPVIERLLDTVIVILLMKRGVS
jgi:hypothetical protein